MRSSGIELHVTPDLVDQEFITTIAPPAFWEGSCSVTGDLFGGVVQGRAFFERKGFHRLATVESFFGEVGSEVIANVEPLLPSTPTHESLLDLLAYRPGYDCLKGVNPESIGRNLLSPIREIVDRGGKAWRSYAAVACCDVVGGDSRKFRKWLALPELVHSGSLIVDDVEDQSETRRGGPTCHRLFGEPLAINAGTFAYFLAEKAIREMDGLTDETRLRIYELYFGAMRAAHAGQALDLGGAGHEVAAAIASGETERLEARVLACYRLKSGVPASAFAAMGAIVGGGTEVQVTAISDLFESLGTAFQIRDDVLNLRGFARGLKSKGEDVSNGTVTLVVAKAIGVLPPELRRHLWGLLQSKRESQSDIADVIAILEACGSVSDCDVLARDLVEHAWDTVEHHFEPSIAKLTLRAFSWYLLEREY